MALSIRLNVHLRKTEPSLRKQFICGRPVSRIQLHRLANEILVFLCNFLVFQQDERLAQILLINVDVDCSKYPVQLFI
jgi:hypothetical protein